MASLVGRGICKFYGALPALCDVNFALRSGTTALLGPNGSGKSTLLSLLATLHKPDHGAISYSGYSYAADLRPLRAVIGYMPQTLDLPARMTPHHALCYLAQVRGLHNPEKAAQSALMSLGMAGLARTPMPQLSGGQAQLVGAAQALMGRPRLLLLDEPTRGLSPDERLRFWRAVARAAPRIVLFSTHIPAEAEDRAEWVLILHSGHVLYEGTAAALKAAAAGKVCEGIIPVEALPSTQARHRISLIRGDGPTRTIRVVGQPPEGLSFVPVAPSLEDAYLLHMP